MSDRRGGWKLYLLLAAVFAIALGGCQTVPREPEGRRSLAIGPCADRLHQIAGHLLLYYSQKGKLPPTLAELQTETEGPGDLPPLVCPVSGKPYSYNPDGEDLPNRRGRVLVYDSEPTHVGRRWGLVTPTETPGKGPFATRILLLPEDWEPSGEGS